MNQKLIITCGLPASGKSTWAKEFVKNNKNIIRISNDEFRLMFFNRQFDKDDTKYVDKARDFLVDEFLRTGSSVLIDNTNLSPKKIKEYEDLAEQYRVEFVIKDFRNVQ